MKKKKRKLRRDDLSELWEQLSDVGDTIERVEVRLLDQARDDRESKVVADCLSTLTTEIARTRQYAHHIHEEMIKIRSELEYQSRTYLVDCLLQSGDKKNADRITLQLFTEDARRQIEKVPTAAREAQREQARRG